MRAFENLKCYGLGFDCEVFQRLKSEEENKLNGRPFGLGGCFDAVLGLTWTDESTLDGWGAGTHSRTVRAWYVTVRWPPPQQPPTTAQPATGPRR